MQLVSNNSPPFGDDDNVTGISHSYGLSVAIGLQSKDKWYGVRIAANLST